MATGSQGEPGAALDRLASNSHPDLSLADGDTVLFSSRVIPGNERAVAALTRNLERFGVTVISDAELNMPIHASGHPAKDELRDMYRWVQPEIAIPVHGEASHMHDNAQIAREVGVDGHRLSRCVRVLPELCRLPVRGADMGERSRAGCSPRHGQVPHRRDDLRGLHQRAARHASQAPGCGVS